MKLRYERSTQAYEEFSIIDENNDDGHIAAAHIFDEGDPADIARAEDLARLFCAAPELLDACGNNELDAAHNAASELFEDPEANNEELRDALAELFDALNAHYEHRLSAIAKAKGESPC